MTTPGKGAYGYGLRIGRMHNRALVYHGGSINGFDALLMRFTDERVTIVVLRNADYGTPSEDVIGRDLAAILFGTRAVTGPRAAIRESPEHALDQRQICIVDSTVVVCVTPPQSASAGLPF